MRRQQLQHANVMTHSGSSAVTFFQTLSEQYKHWRKRPVAIRVRMIRSRRATFECREVMQRIEHLIAMRVAANVCRHDHIQMNNIDAINIRLRSLTETHTAAARYS